MTAAKPHPGFGAFAKAHREFHDALAEEGWTPVAGYSGVEEKILSGAVEHDWCEEVFVVSGSLSIGTLAAKQDAVRLPVGTYAVRPPHIVHGPFFSDDGCLLIEFMYYPPHS